MDHMEAIDALYDYVNTNADSDTKKAFNSAYIKFIDWQTNRTKAIDEAKLLGNQLINQFSLNREVA